ncbi:MAG: AsmA family protein [Elusimicrobia bacterium]|nr:AsmA family protein [Elusimicrobiota bacterium]
MAREKRKPRWLRALLFPFRVIALLGLLALLVVAGSALVVRVMLSREELSALIASQLQDALQRPVQVGDVNVMLLQGIRIRGLRVLETQGFPGPDFLSSEIAVAKYRWRALLQRRLEFSEVRLVAPKIQLVRRQDGLWNVQGLLKPREDAPKPLVLPVGLAADVVTIENAQLSVHDLVRQRLVSVHAFDLEVADFSSSEPFPFTVAFETTANLAGKSIELKASGAGRMSLAGFKWPDAWLEADKIRVAAGGDVLTGTGKVQDFTAPSVDLKLRLPRLDSETLGRYGPVPPGINVPPSLARVRIRRPTPERLQVESLDLAAEPLKLRASGALLLGPRGTYRFNLSAPTAPLDRVGALWAGFAPRKLSGMGDMSFTVAGKLEPEDRPVIERLAVHLKNFSAVISSNAAISGADVTITAAKNLDEIEVLAPRGRFLAYGNAFSDINLAVRLADGDLDIDRLDLTWSVSHIKLKGRIRNFSAPKGVDVEGSVDKLMLQEAIAATAAIVQQIKAAKPKPEEPEGEKKWARIFRHAIPKTFPATNGSLRIAELVQPNFNTLNVDLKWGLRGISTGLENVAGWVRTGFGPGRVSNIQELKESHKLLRITFLPFEFMQKMNKATRLSLGTLYPNTLDFTRIYGQYALMQGVIDITPFHVDSGQIVLCAQGKADIPHEQVAMHVLTRLTAAQAPSLPQYLNDEKGRPSIGFFVKGDLNKPDPEFDIRKMSATAIEDCLQEGLKRGQALSPQ